MHKACTVIGIAGPSGSGKSTLCRHLQSALSGALTLVPEDAYYRDGSHLSFEDRTMLNYDHPDSLEHDLLAEHLIALKQGQPVASPCYDFSTHTRTTDTTPLAAAPIILVEGILLLAHAQLRDQLDIKIYLETDNVICLSRRIERDTTERDRVEEDVRRQYRETVEPMLQEYVLPSRAHADLIIPSGRENTTARAMLVSYLQAIC